MIDKEIGIYIMSCDKNIDIAKHCLKSINKYWDCKGFKVFLGTNTHKLKCSIPNLIHIESKSSNWKNETLDQLHLINVKYPEIDYLIVILDDFIFRKKINIFEIKKISKIMINSKLKYLRLKKIEESIFQKLLNIFSRADLFDSYRFIKIRKSHPYYSSLQIALWDIEYLKYLINISDNIWNFENIISNVIHYSVAKSLFKYRHVVEKGKWEIGAKKYCLKYINYFNPGDRRYQKFSLKRIVRYRLQPVRFFLFGYIKRRMNK